MDCDFYVQVHESSLERLVGGVVFEDGRHYTFVYENEDLVYEEEVYDYPNSIEELAGFVEQDGKKAFLCGGLVWRIIVISIQPCQRLRRQIQSSPLLRDRDQYLDLAKLWMCMVFLVLFVRKG